MLYLFEIIKKWPIRKGMGWGGGVGGHIFEIRGRTFGRSGVFGVCTGLYVLPVSCTVCYFAFPSTVCSTGALFLFFFVRHNAPQSQKTHFGFP